MTDKKIMLKHGSGGEPMHSLIKDLLLKKLGNPILKELTDSAVIDYKERLAFTTDSFVVSPLRFRGADIGKLSVCGTVNDLVMVGATPEFLSLAFIIEEGLDYNILEYIVNSISLNAKKAKVSFVTGDIKVVERGGCDKIFINTCGIGRLIRGRALSLKKVKAGDKIILTGNIAEHGLAVIGSRKGLDLELGISSDCASLNDLLIPIIRETNAIKFMRDPTRGGIASTLNEIAQATSLGLIIEEKAIPISTKVRAASELLGIDPLYVANEGKAIIVVKSSAAGEVLNLLKKHPLGRKAQIIGSVAQAPRARVILNTIVGTQRIVDMLSSEPLPRIC